MIISYICGGLGNQMFQYAAGLRLARKHQTQLKLDLSDYRTGSDKRPEGLGQFARPVKLFDLCISAKPATDAEIDRFRDPYFTSAASHRLVRQIRRFQKDFRRPATHISEKQYRFEPKILDLPDNVYLHGYRQSWKYFDDIADVIREEFRFKDPGVMEHALGKLADIRQPGIPLVSLHVRRGDLAHASEILQNAKLVYSPPLKLDYIFAAVRRFPQNAHFLVFSDTAKDIAWCRQNIRADWLDPSRLHFSEGNTDLQDMAMMSACNHHIIANSTFSWWGAWLDASPGRRVVAPAKWSPLGGSLAIVPDDLIPPSWEIV